MNDAPPPALAREERVFGLVTVYRAAEQHFAYFDQIPDLDWGKEFMRFLPLVEQEQTVYDYYRILQRFVTLLQDGHTRVYLPGSIQAKLDGLPIILDVVEGQWVVVERYPTREVLREDIPVGSVVLAIEGSPPPEYFEKHFFPYISAGRIEAKRANLAWRQQYPSNAQVRVALRYPDGSTRRRLLRADRRTVKWTDDLRQQYQAPLSRPPGFHSERLAGGILYVRYGACDDHCLDEFSKLIESLVGKWPTAIVLDVRHNQGGGTPTKTVASLISEPIPWYECATRWSASYVEAQLQFYQPGGEPSEHIRSRYGLPDQFSANWYSLTSKDSRMEPSEVHYDGPLLILTDCHTASAAEDLVVLLRGAGRAIVVGEPTLGSTGQPISFDLPGGGGVQVCTVRVRYADGREFIGVGCQPDIPVQRTAEAITKGRDEVLEAALEHARRQCSNGSPAKRAPR